MSSNAIFFGWNRSLPGRERQSAEHFGEFVVCRCDHRDSRRV